MYISQEHDQSHILSRKIRVSVPAYYAENELWISTKYTVKEQNFNVFSLHRFTPF